MGGLTLTKVRIVCSFPAWSGLECFLGANMSLGTGSGDTVVDDAVSSRSARLAVRFFRSLGLTKVEAVWASDWQFSSQWTVVTPWALLSVILLCNSAEVTVVTRRTSALLDTCVTELRVWT